jgi:DNA repair protein RecO
MSHAIHSIEGILIDDRPYSEAGRILFVLSRDLGLVMLLAQGVREQKSKLRHLLTLGTIGTFEFVEGKEVKRLTSIFPESHFESIFQHLYKRNVFSHVVTFISRLMLGEMDSDVLYLDFIKGLNYLENSTDDTVGESIEIVMIVNLLTNLGYFDEAENLDFIEKDFEYIKLNKAKIIEKINKSIYSTQV